MIDDLRNPSSIGSTEMCGSRLGPVSHVPRHDIIAVILYSIAVFALLPVRGLHAEQAALISGAPSGLTNRPNPLITIGGTNIVAYRYKLDDNDYSEVIPVEVPIRFSASLTISGRQFDVGDPLLQRYLDGRIDFIGGVTFTKVEVPTPIFFLANPMRLRLQTDNSLVIEGHNIGNLSVSIHTAPSVPATVVNQSLLNGDGSVTYRLTTASPETDFITIKNNSSTTSSFRLNLNNRLFARDADVLAEIQAMPNEFANEPIQRKVWRFIRDNRYHWYPPSADGWESSSPALFFNSIGFGYCGHAAALYCQLLSMLNFPTRFWALNGHAVPEVLIDGRWEMYDPDLQVYYLNHDGQVAGVGELTQHPELITSPISPLEQSVYWAYSQLVADIYASADDNDLVSWVYDSSVRDYLLSLDIPPGGVLDFPGVFISPIHTIDYTEAPSYTNVRLTVPRGWEGTLNIPLVIHSIGYEGAHTLSVIGEDTNGRWQTLPTIAAWTADSWAPITTPSESLDTDPVTFTANETSTIYYTLDGSLPTTSSIIYAAPIDVSSAPVLKYFGVDRAGNHEDIKCFSTVSGASYDGATDVQVSVSRTSPQSQGTVISFTASASGSCGSYVYRFLVGNAVTKKWTVAQAYDKDSVWTWNTSGIDPGMYEIQVWARNSGSTAAYEAYRSVSYTIYAPGLPPASSVTLAPDKPSPQSWSTVVTLTAAATGGSGAYEYMYCHWNPKTGIWSVAQPYSSNPVWVWNTAAADTGTYEIQVWARNSGSTADYETYTSIFYTIYAPGFQPVSNVILTPDKPPPQSRSTVVTLTATATGGSGAYEYMYCYWNPKTGMWSVAQPYSSNPVWAWNTAAADTGTYEIQVWARNSGSTADYEAYQSATFTINP